MNADLIRTVLIWALPVLLAITLHEAAHAYAAKAFGDDTAAQLGRLSLNPLRHIDPIGTVAMPLMLYLATQGNFVFGYAKPVPVQWARLRHPRRDMSWVALAGPLSNLFQALIWALIGSLVLRGDADGNLLASMARAGLLVNLVMFAFNLFPLPPLDGGRVVVSALPVALARPYARLEPFGFFIVLALVVSGIITTIWMLPLMRGTLGALMALLPSTRQLLAL